MCYYLQFMCNALSERPGYQIPREMFRRTSLLLLHQQEDGVQQEEMMSHQ